MNLYFKFVSFGISLVVLTSAIIFFVVNTILEADLQNNILQKHTAQAESSMANIDRFLYERLNDVKNYAKMSAFRAKHIDQINATLSDIAQSNELYYSFSFFDMDRFRLADSKGLSVGKQHGFRLYWKQINDNTETVMDISNSESLGRTVIHLGAVVRNKANQPIGVLVARVLIENLYAVIHKVSFGEQEYESAKVDLVDEHMNILYSTHQPHKVLKSKYPDIIPQSTLESSKSSLKFSTKDELFFLHRQEGYHSFMGKNWTLIISVSKEVAFASLASVNQNILLSALIVLILACSVTIIFAKIISKPLKTLRNAVQQISEGNYNVQIKGNTKDEFGYLMRQFNATVVKLKNKESLEKKITKELFAKNEEIQSHQKKIISQANAINRAYKEIKSKHHSMNLSLSYAEKIQTAILPNEKELQDIFDDFFILYKPKDMVSGDFFWFKKVKQNHKDLLIIACADCSGHGVPGAFLSMLGINSLNNAVENSTDFSPLRLLQKVDRDITTTLKQNYGDSEGIHDGVEMAICTLDLQSNEMNYAGAGIPLLLYQNEHWNLIKADKTQLGRRFDHGQKEKMELHEHSFQLTAGQRFYLYSDGYKDQIGGKEHKTYLRKRFRMFLGLIGDKHMAVQKNLLKKELDDWKGENPQTDDILVMGYKIKLLVSD